MRCYEPGPESPLGSFTLTSHTIDSLRKKCFIPASILERMETMTKQEVADYFDKYLKAEGFTVTIDDDGDLIFKQEGRTYVLIIDEKDPDFLRLAFPNFWTIESEDERKRATHAAMLATAKTKVAKVYLAGDNTWAAIETFAKPEGFAGFIARGLLALRAAANNFAETMRGES